jgi:hypothetical protein
MTSLKDIRNELLSALSLHPHAPTTEQPTSTPTSSMLISKDTLEAIEVSALVLAQAMKILVETGWLPPSQSKTTESAAGEEVDEQVFYYYSCRRCDGLNILSKSELTLISGAEQTSRTQSGGIQ